MVLHAQPTLYTLDGLQGVKTPLGLHADRLGVDIHVVAAEASPVRNLDLCVRSAHLAVKSIVASPCVTTLRKGSSTSAPNLSSGEPLPALRLSSARTLATSSSRSKGLRT